MTDYDQYDSWVEECAKGRVLAAREVEAKRRVDAGEPARGEKKVALRKLPYKEQQELEGMEAGILKAEEEVQKWHKLM